MLYAIISDIHGNLEALEAVLATLKVDKIICLGDVIGYGPNPKECLEKIKSLNIPTVAGNHEKALLGEIDTKWFNERAKLAIEWTATQVETSAIKDLPTVGEEADFHFVHASLRDPVNEYVMSISEALPTFALMTKPLCFIGHTHRPGYLARKKDGFYESRSLHDGDEVLAYDFDRLIINVGSVGQPRDGDPRAAYGIFDTQTRLFSLHRIPYDIQQVQAKMKAVSLPQKLIDRLSFGT